MTIYISLNTNDLQLKNGIAMTPAK